ncbi:MAG: hypothetical protein VZQ55_02820 [Ruminococcus sp.]|nr:hypothetical protein [Ruminococcus sp.]
MKTKVKRLSKRTLAMFLGVLMLITSLCVGTMITANASNTSDGTARLFFKMNAVSWWIADSGNQNFAYFYNNTTNKNAWSAHSVQQTGNYYYVVVPSGTWEGVILTRNNTTTSPSWDNKWNQTGDLTWTAGKNYISAFSEGSATATFSTYQVDSTASLAASSTNITTAETTQLTPSLSSNTDYNDIKSTSYSVTTNPGSAGSVTSDGVFSATAAGTYTVTATVTYNAKGFTGITKTATASKDITVTAATVPGITSIAPASTSLNIGETTSITTVLANTSSPTVTYSSSDATVLSVTKDSNTSATVKALKPGSATITASLSDSGTTATKTTSSITVKTPAVSTFSYSPNTIYTGGATATPTVSMNTSNQNSSSTVSYAYSITNGTSYASINATTGVITSKTTAGTVTAKVTATVTYNGISYDATKTVSVTVKKPNDVYIYGHQFGGWNWDASSPSTTIKKMTYDVTEDAYYYDATITSIDNYFRFWDDTDSDKHYGPSPKTADKKIDKNGDKVAVVANSQSKSFYTSGETGTLRFWFSLTDKKAWVTGEATHSVTVTSTNGTVKKGTNAITSGSTTSVGEETASEFTATPATGYKFDGWTLGTGIENKSASTSANPISIVTKSSGNYTLTANYSEVTYTTLTAVGKYSTDGSTYNTAMSTNPTISNTSGTYKTGVTVTAPDVDGYQFVDWYTANGTFANSADKQTTFKPNANSAQAVARYKKIFTITSSVDSTGTGAGTVTTDKTSVEAGGSYTITANAANGSAIESVMVGNTNKGTNKSTTISNVSADQDVKVKFKSNITIRGGSTIGTNWTTGDAMTSNAAGTEFTKAYTNVAGSSSGTIYEFKLYVNGTVNEDGNADIKITGGTATGTCTHQSDGYKNYVLTLKQNADVTIKSNGTKITEIKVVPVNATKHTVTFKKAANTTITGQYEGVNFSTASADAAVQVYEGDTIDFKVTPASGYYISSLTGATYVAGQEDYSLTVNEAKTITPTASGLFNVKAVTNKSARGTVSVNKSTAAPGESITITVSPKNGVLKSLTCTYANGAVYTCDLSTKAWTKTTNANNAQAQRSVDGMAAFAFRDKVSKLMTSATAKLFSGADTTYTMALAENSAATINATFDAYSGESTWYYNGYDNSGNALSGYHTKQMTEGMVSGEKFSYYHVEGRTGTDQLMTVSDGVPGSGDRYVYFVRPTDWGTGWSASNNPRAHFWNDSASQTTWPGTEMTWAWNNDYGQGVYKTKIPTGAKYVKFNDNNGKQTVSIDLTTTGGAYYLAGGGSGTDSDGYKIAEWNTGWADQGWVASGTEYFYQNSTHNGDYTGDFNTKGFYNHNTASKLFAKPKELGSNTGDYYINVLYPNTTYTINGVTKKTGTNPMIIWSAEPLAGDDETTTIYAKDGSIRSESYGSTYANIADTKIYLGNETVGTKHSGNITNQTYETYKAAKGDTIVIKTQIGATDSSTLSNAADLKAKYYVRGFCVNGEVTELLEWNADGLYTLTYKVPEDEDLSKIEITPIYYLKDTTANPIVTYRVTGFTDELKAVGSGKPNWGNTLYTYPFYGKLGSNNNALGAYPGQPMVYYKGQYQMQIPQKSTAWDIYYADGALSGYSGNTAKANAVANTNVSGVTMSNGYYDLVHRQIAGFGDNSASADHVQTYDYGDFFKIFNEKKPVDNIVFDFKYRTKKHNFESQPAASTTKSTLDTNYGTNGNGFELLTNFHGRNVDLFGDPLSGDAADPSKTTPVYVVSIGGVNGSKGVENIAGYYATEWMVYGSSDGSNYSRISAGGKNSIPPEVLVLNDDDTTSFNTTTYPSADASHNLTNWKALYTALEAYRGKPVMISYEAADAQIGAGNYSTSGSGGATRNDGRWLYSKNGENITGKIKIQYSDDNGDNYTDLDTENPKVSGLSAYFTNDGVEGEMTYATTIDPDKTFDFEAKTTNADYKFVGWYMEDGTKITTDNASLTERSGSYTFVAKFMQVTTGQLILSHSVDTNATYKGAGTAKIGVVVKNGDDEVVRTYDLSTSDITLDDKIIKSDNSDYTIEVTLEATATGDDTYGTTLLATPSGQESTYFHAASTTTQGKTKTIVLKSFTVASLFSGTTQNVKNIIYHSYFTQAVFNYTVTFSYKDRTGAAKSYTRQGKLSSNQAANENYVSDDNGNKKLLPAFIKTIAPHVSNFGQTITWNFNDSYAFTNSGSIYNCTANISATQTSNNKRDVTFVLPYQHTNGIASLDSNGIGTYASETVNFALTGNNAVTFESIPKLLDGAENHIFDENGKKNWIAAPKVIRDGSTQKFFKYWTIKTTSGRDVAKCYFNGFNYAALDNYVVTAVYDTVQTSSVDSDVFTDATYLETSRNQWNDNKDRTKTEKTYAADLLLNDFIVNYNYKGVDIYKGGTDTDDIQDLGIVVERVKLLDILNQDGSYNTDMSNYQDTTQNLDKVKSVINGTAQTGFTKHSIEKTALDNKNRYQVYDAFYNGAGWDVEKQTSAAKYTYKNYVYRIYSYMKYTEDGETKIALAEIPSYFTMYDEATKSYPLS